MLTFLAQPLFWLLKIYGLLGNWGLAIIAITFLIKLLFYPLAETSGRSMAKMKTVAPRIKPCRSATRTIARNSARA